MEGRSTVFSAFWLERKERIKEKKQFLPDMTTDQLNRLRRRLDISTLALLVIDEISYISPLLLGQIDNRLRQLMSLPEIPFGGLSVILMGDFFQLPPVGASYNLFSATVKLFVEEKELSPEEGHNPQTRGTFLFSRFIKFELTQQMRAAEDIEHTEMLEQMRSPQAGQARINRSRIENLKILCSRDMEEDELWHRAPIVVTSNRERCVITNIRTTFWAVKNQTPRFVWKVPLTGDLSSYFNAATNAYLYRNNPALYEHFVAGVPGFLTENINPSLGLSNGTPVIYHSLTLDPREDYHSIVESIANLSSFQTDIRLEFPPSYIHVSIPHLNPDDFVGRTLVPSEIVILVQISKFPDKVNFRLPNTDLSVDVRKHAVEMGFAVTVHKMQGQTCERVIVDLNERPFSPSINFNGLYVSLSQVKKSLNLRLMPLQPTVNNLNYLYELKPSPLLTQWLSGFNTNGTWSAELSKSVALAIPATQRRNRRRIHNVH